ncbi:flagellar biosynthesis protein FlhB [Isachenkonia alkalipeptolytica]|nr:flagellar biosynthesis protein FlhB [Isachenkonia alkalipeptolytica]
MVRIDLQLFNEEKTEKATPKKKQDSRKKGQVHQSKEVNSAFLLIGAFSVLGLSSGYIGFMTRNFTINFFQQYLNGRTMITFENAHRFVIMAMLQMLMLVGPLFLATVIIGFSASYFQVGPLFTVKTLAIKLSKLNPLEGFKRIFSLKSLVELFKSFVKIFVIGYIVFHYTSGEIARVFSTITMETSEIVATISSLTMNIGIRASLALVILAIIDYYYQKYDHEKQIKMTKKEVKEERKQIDGNPMIKSKIREKQRQMSMQRMMEEIPKADVVITNPTHFAVAIEYNAESFEAPRVVAKGQDIIAQNIKKRANEHNVTIVENKYLARTLYKMVNIGEFVPPDLYQGVAEVLAYVYKLNKKTKGGLS